MSIWGTHTKEYRYRVRRAAVAARLISLALYLPKKLISKKQKITHAKKIGAPSLNRTSPYGHWIYCHRIVHHLCFWNI